MKKAGIRMIIDAHTHIWGGNYDKHTRQLLDVSERFGVSKVYVSGLRSHYSDEAEIASLNAEVNRFMKEQPNLIEGYCYVNPAHANALDVLKRGIEDYGMAGMKLWVATFCDDPRVFPLVEACIERHIPILIHSFQKAVSQLTYESTGIHVANLAERYPQAKLLMAHFGGNCYHGLKAVRGYPNIWHDFSGSIYRRDDLDYAVEQVGAERIVFGSDMSATASLFLVNYGQVEEAELTAEQRELIYYKNAQELFNRQPIGGNTI